MSVCLPFTLLSTLSLSFCLSFTSLSKLCLCVGAVVSVLFLYALSDHQLYETAWSIIHKANLILLFRFFSSHSFICRLILVFTSNGLDNEETVVHKNQWTPFYILLINWRYIQDKSADCRHLIQSSFNVYGMSIAMNILNDFSSNVIGNKEPCVSNISW